MNGYQYLICVLLFFSSALPAADNNNLTIQTGEQLFLEGLYEDAVAHYRNQVTDVDHLSSEKDALRLSQALVLAERAEEALSLLETTFANEGHLKAKKSQEEKVAAFFKGYCCRKLKNYGKALDYFTIYLSDNPDLLANHALFEMGLCSLALKKKSEATDYFSKLNHKDRPHQDILEGLSALYLAKIALDDSQTEKALQFLNSNTFQNHVFQQLKYAIAYLSAETYYSTGHYSQAIDQYKKALPSLNSHRIEWYCNTLCHQGLSHLKLVEQENAREHYRHASELLSQLASHLQDEEGWLLLARCCLMEAEALDDANAYQKAAELLNNQKLFNTEEGKNKALLLNAQVSRSFLERDRLYKKLAQRPIPFDVWLLRGYHALKEVRLRGNSDLDASEPLQIAIDSLQKSISLKNQDQSWSTQLLAEACERQATVQSLLKGIAVLQNLRNENRDSWLRTENPDKIFYLEGLLSLKLAEQSPSSPVTLPSIYKMLTTALTLYPDGHYAGELQFLSGMAAYLQGHWQEAKEAFKAAETIGVQNRQAEALFWLAASLENVGADQHEIQQYRHRLYEEHPESLYAGEAYFRYWTLNDYMGDKKEPTDHLQAMASRFPKNPYLIYAHYLIGIQQTRNRKNNEGRLIRKKKLTAAIDSFQRAEELFAYHSKNASLPSHAKTELTTLYYRTTLERAKANLAIAEESQGVKQDVYNEYAEAVLKRLADELSSSSSGNNSIGALFHGIEEETLYRLALAHLNNHHNSAADAVLEKMLEKYSSAKITRGYYLARAWCLKGSLLNEAGAYDEAQKALAHAEDAAKGPVFNADELLDLWLQQSACYKAQGNLTAAMRRLSDVINKDAVSSLRIKAMYLRAELYESQGRYDLARRQLIAVAKKGGQWASLAKEKLSKTYGYEHELPR